jgi:hypothetical protein
MSKKERKTAFRPVAQAASLFAGASIVPIMIRLDFNDRENSPSWDEMIR